MGTGGKKRAAPRAPLGPEDAERRRHNFVFSLFGLPPLLQHSDLPQRLPSITSSRSRKGAKDAARC